jgi:glycosyltransferase involved in cell wall biosynthesis
MADISDFVNQLNSIINETSNTSKNVSPTTETVNVNNNVTNIVNNSLNENKKKVKILIVSTHINQVNGYSKVIYSIINELAKYDWLEIIHFGTQKIASGSIGRAYPSNVKAIDGSEMEKNKQLGFAFSELPSVINTNKPDIVFIYNDLGVVCNYIEDIRKSIQNRFFKIWTYLDITYKFPPQALIDILNRDVERIFCFTKSWKDELKNHGITRPVDVMNHGYEPKIIRPIPKELARQSLGLPKDVILFTSLNKNIPRKRLDILIMAFAKLVTRFPTKSLFMLIVADMGTRGGYPLFEIFGREIKQNGGSVDMLGNRLLITSKDVCYKDEDINILNNCSDIGVSCADGEGFGLCTFEQMAVGIPQIVPAINGYTEYCNSDICQMIKPKMRVYLPQGINTVTGEAEIVDPEDVAKAMEKYAFDENLRKLHGKLCKEQVANLTWDKCCSILTKRLQNFRDDDD